MARHRGPGRRGDPLGEDRARGRRDLRAVHDGPLGARLPPRSRTDRGGLGRGRAAGASRGPARHLRHRAHQPGAGAADGRLHRRLPVARRRFGRVDRCPGAYGRGHAGAGPAGLSPRFRAALGGPVPRPRLVAADHGGDGRGGRLADGRAWAGRGRDDGRPQHGRGGLAQDPGQPVLHRPAGHGADRARGDDGYANDRLPPRAAADHRGGAGPLGAGQRRGNPARAHG